MALTEYHLVVWRSGEHAVVPPADLLAARADPRFLVAVRLNDVLKEALAADTAMQVIGAAGGMVFQPTELHAAVSPREATWFTTQAHNLVRLANGQPVRVLGTYTGAAGPVVRFQVVGDQDVPDGMPLPRFAGGVTYDDVAVA